MRVELERFMRNASIAFHLSRANKQLCLKYDNDPTYIVPGTSTDLLSNMVTCLEGSMSTSTGDRS
jgi:hypothetical protein